MSFTHLILPRMESSPSEVYKQQISSHNALLEQLQTKRTRLGWMRFFVFVVTVIISYQVFINAGIWGLLPVVTGIGVLLFLVSKDVNNNQHIQNIKTLLHINAEELKILEHQFHHRYDGHEFDPHVHDYANDLDLFGNASLFQWMNRCSTEQGHALLAKNLLDALPPDTVAQRQEAVKEISPMIGWRQQLQAYGEHTRITRKTEERTMHWLAEEEKHFTGSHWKYIVAVYSIFTVGSAIAATLGYIAPGSFSFLFGIYLVTSIILSRNTIKPYILLSGIVKEVATLQQLVGWIEEQGFNSPHLTRMLHDAGPDGQKASLQIRELKAILDRFDVRLNIAGLLFFNSFLLWDVRQMMSLNAWRRKNKDHVKKWFELIAEAEVLNSLAAIHFNHPHWTFPNYTNEDFLFRAKMLGHPLIPAATRVDNDFEMAGRPKISLITGSNMAGKSTFLRSIGVNFVLASAGAPVCAESMELSPCRLMSSMRIADNLAENTSTFYAELKKLKTIIEAVNRKEKLLILLDEILRGTNSYDRHTGSAALIGQLIRENAVAVIATHDVELAKLENNHPEAIENYHFDVQVEGEELYFDYKLKEDVCTSLNASILMKKIGIELRG